MSFDIIGDIHGEAAKLDALFRRLGYARLSGGWRPPHGRQAIFVGDLIDRGPEQVAVCWTVRAMVDAGHARCILGNHELNAIGYWTLKPQAMRARGDKTPAAAAHLRPRSLKNEEQHRAFLEQVGLDSPLHAELVSWFRTLPVTLDLPGIRVAHAWWQQDYVDQIGRWLPDGKLSDDAMVQKLFVDKTKEFIAIEALTKGQEISLPPGTGFFDYDGHFRDRIRTRWWREDARTYRDVALVPERQANRIPDVPLPADQTPTRLEGKPVFIGHYWMAGTPSPLTARLACVDWSAARDEPLVAYRWDGERELDDSRFVASTDAFEAQLSRTCAV